jgi:hypothetical protein
VRFWDTSAIVPTLVEESASPEMRLLVANDPEMAVWWTTRVECLSAIARRERLGELEPDESPKALEALADLVAVWVEVPPTEGVRDRARSVVRVHDVRTADAFQLAAALVAADDRPETLQLVTLDDRLAVAARREGFSVLP